jgi:beta-mannosidase
MANRLEYLFKLNQSRNLWKNSIYQDDLSGQWTFESRSADKNYRAYAAVPGCVHTDLLKAGLIPDPYYRDNEATLQWIGESNWLYRRSYQVSKTLLAKEKLSLRCEGLDTFAEVRINGSSVAKTDNMFRTWEWDIKGYLKEGENQIEVEFTSPLPYGRKCRAEHYLHHTGIDDHRIEGGNWVRKEACNYGWDWGPMFVTAGIWKPIYLLAWDEGRIADVYTEPQVADDNSGQLKIRFETEGVDTEIQPEFRVALTFNGQSVIDTSLPLPPTGTMEHTFNIEKVERWWPAGMGEQPLYNLELSLVSSTGKIIDKRSFRIGFRDLDLVTEFDEWGQSFKFRANGVDFFAKGANWIPADTFDNRVSTEDLKDLLQSTIDANMNCIRVWGGGLYERDEFFDLCDELGICVWQDFMFACSAYPVHLPEFIQNVIAEAVDNVKRLRHHASLFLWCGNNELEQIQGLIGDDHGNMRWDHYCMLFDVKLREVIEKHHPTASYWPASEHSPIGNRTPTIHSCDPRWGDAHLWKVWHGREPFEWYRGSLHRFCSEFGFQSFPHPTTIDTCTDESDRSITSYVMEKHQRSPMGNQAIMAYMLEWFRLPIGFENTVWLSQILQSLGIKYAVEHWRRNMPRCMGAIYWQLDDCWPVASWSSIDSLHRWKALHYEARRFFAPDMVSVIENETEQTIELYATSDNTVRRQAKLLVKTWHAKSGELLDQQEFAMLTPANGSNLVATYKPQLQRTDSTRFDLIFEIEYMVEDTDVAQNMATWVKPKHLNLASPNIESHVGKDESGACFVELRTNCPALWVWVDVENQPDLRWSDNFFHLFPDTPKRIYLKTNIGIQSEEIRDNLRIRSLWDTFHEAG